MLGVQSRVGPYITLDILQSQLSFFEDVQNFMLKRCMALSSVMSNLYKCKDNAMVAIPAKCYSF